MKYSFEVTTTQKCDMACTYCFEGEELQNTTKQRSTPDIIKAVNSMLESDEFRKIYDEGISLAFWGGEPTQNPKMIIELIEEFKDKDITFFFYTNGFSYDNIEKLIVNFKFNDISSERYRFQISFDGLSHDDERIDHRGKGTSEKILNNIRMIRNKFPEVGLSIKSTLPIMYLEEASKHWDYFKDLIDEFPNFVWAPTLEYTNKYEISNEQLSKITEQFKIIAKKEIDYFQKNNKFVMSWFGSAEHVVCSAGANIGNIDIDGNISVCHGALYSENKDDFVFGHISEDDVVGTILKSHAKHIEILEVPELCKGCEATVCFQCPIVQYDHSKLETYEEKYHDVKNDLCQVYKSFGKIDRTVQRYLKI